MTIDLQGMLEAIEEGDAVWFDATNGVAGQTFPIGTAQMPVDNFADLAAIVTQRATNRVRLLSNITIGGGITNWRIIGDVGLTVDFNGQVLTTCRLEYVATTGNLGAGSVIYCESCVVAATTVQEGIFFNCEMDGVHIFTANPSYIYHCYGRGCTLDMANDPTVSVFGGKGNWTVVNLTAGGTLNLFLDAGEVTLAASCTGGTVNIYGTCRVVDNSGGAAVNDNRVCTEARLAELDPANMPADLDTLLARLTAARAGYLDELAAANLPTDVAAVAALVAAIPTESYFEQTVPILMNGTQTLNNAAGNKDFIASNATGPSALISTDDAKVQEVCLLIIGRAVNSYAGSNALDCTTSTHNQWRINLDGGAYADLVNEEADGQMLDNDWLCPVEGAIHPFTLMFDVTSQVTNIDGKIGVRLENGRAEQASLVVTCDMYLKILWKL